MCYCVAVTLAFLLKMSPRRRPLMAISSSADGTLLSLHIFSCNRGFRSSTISFVMYVSELNSVPELAERYMVVDRLLVELL